MTVDLNYFDDIENALGYNSSSTNSYAESQLLKIIEALAGCEKVLIKDAEVELNDIDDFRRFKSRWTLISSVNTNHLLEQLNKKAFSVSKDELGNIELAYQYNSAASIKSLESSLIRIIRKLVLSEPVIIEVDELTLRNIKEFNGWVRTKSFRDYTAQRLIEIMKDNG